ncbi:protein Aster-B-like isoform X2 [Lineus longissimus]|uniref:protein Aster-B-like isoform X2 n=1 Tax=Lineus longissimus TaxID=88925 RepID=UPI00315DAF6A
MSKIQRRTLLDIASAVENEQGMEKTVWNDEEKTGGGILLSANQSPISPSPVPMTLSLPLSPVTNSAVSSVTLTLSPAPPSSGSSFNGTTGPNSPTAFSFAKKTPECASTHSSQESIAGTSPSSTGNPLASSLSPTDSLQNDQQVSSTILEESPTDDLPTMSVREKSLSEPPKIQNSLPMPPTDSPKMKKRDVQSQSLSGPEIKLNGHGSSILQTIPEPSSSDPTDYILDKYRLENGATHDRASTPPIGVNEQNSKDQEDLDADDLSKSEPPGVKARRNLQSNFTVMSPGAKNVFAVTMSSRRGSLPVPVRPTFRYNANNETLSIEAPDVYEEKSSIGGLDDQSNHFDNDLDIAAQILGRKPSDIDMYSDTDYNGDFNKSISSVTSDGSRKSYDSKKRKSSYWYSVLSPNYKSKCEDFKKLFKDIPNEERLVVDYSCALQKDILVHGRLYVTQNWICFYANIFRWETHITIRCKDITAMTKEKTARVIPNAIQICTKTDKLFLTSFGARDKTYLMLFRVWQNALLAQPMSPQELWQWVHYSYGEELGLTSSDDDYIAPSSEGDKASDNQASPTDSSMEQLDGASTGGEINVAHGTNLSPDRETQPPSSLDDLISSDKNDALDSSAKIGDAELPTDLSDNTDDTDTGEVTCTGHNHFRITVMNEVFQISVDQMFAHLFTDSTFFRDLTSYRKTYDRVLPPWQDEPTPEGHRQRTISYTLTLNSSLGPKTSAATETQTCYSQSKPGVLYVVDTETVNSGIPYGDSFYVVSRYCIQRVNSLKCRLHVTSEIKYKKSVWGMVKGFIDKNCTQGIHEYFNDLAVHLRRESDKAVVVGGEVHKKKKLRKRRATAEINQQLRHTTPDIPTSTLPTSVSKVPHKDEWSLKLNAESLVRILSIVLIVLVMFNAVLYYKLCALEVAANYHHQGKPFRMTPDDINKFPKSQDDWLELLKQQQTLHDLELDRWKDILSSSIQLIEQMKSTLTELRTSIDKPSDGPKLEL